MSRLLLILCVSVAVGAIATGLLHARRATSEGWAVGYSANFIQEDALDPAKNCTGRIYVNALQEPRGMRRDSICGSRKRTDIFRQGEVPVVLDPDARVYWRPEVKSRLEIAIETPRGDVVRETLNGRQVVRYRKRIKPTDKIEAEVWEDPKLHSAVRVVTAHSRYELKDIQEGAQAKALFTIPRGYREIAEPKE